jgi:hypothetical protein
MLSDIFDEKLVYLVVVTYGKLIVELKFWANFLESNRGNAEELFGT